MPRPRTRIGKVFGRLTVVDIAELNPRSSNHKYVCTCTCGNQKITAWDNLSKGYTKSCGCLAAENMANLKAIKAANTVKKQQHKEQAAAARAAIPRYTKHPLWATWRGMIKRCYYKTNDNYRFYGGRGITVCDAWKNDFWQFVADMGPKPGKNYTLDRIDPDGDYEPGNCQWATRYEQAVNTRNVAYVYTATIHNKSMMVTAWCRHFGVNPEPVKKNIKNGTDPAEAVVAAALRKKLWVKYGGRVPSNEYAKCPALAKKFLGKK